MGLHPVTIALFLALAGAGVGMFQLTGDPMTAGVFGALALLVIGALRIAKQWQVAVVLRLGRFSSVKGPGLFVLIPFIDNIASWLDLRTMSTPFNAEQTLTKDSVPVDVDAVLFWRVVDAGKATLEVSDYREAVFWAAQTALRDVMGKSDISELLVGRERIDDELRAMIRERTGPWGIEVLAVEVRDVRIPEGLQDAMSAQAQAEREREARVILADSERRIADMFTESARRYESSPVAFQLRSMNVLLEGMRNGATMLVIPSNAVESMSGASLGLASLARTVSQEAGAPRTAPAQSKGGEPHDA